jgi:DNA-binding transcriptional LysR family regulator
MTDAIEQLTGVVVFARVVAARSFSAAARELGMSKSAVSKQVSRLEAALGARLLNRSTRRLGLTEAGAVLYERCTRIVAELDAAGAELGRLRAAPAGLLRVSAPMSFGHRHVAPLLPEFLAAHPQLRVELALTDRFVDLIEERFDCAVRIAQLPDSSLVARRLAPARRVVCGAPAYFARRGVPRTPDDLRSHDCIDYTYLAAAGGWPFTVGGRLHRVPVRSRFATNNGEAMRAAALAGVGVALIPTFIVGDDLRAGTLQAVLADYETWNAFVHAVYPPTPQVAPKVRAFVDFVAARCAGTPYWDDGLPRHRARSATRRL